MPRIKIKTQNSPSESVSPSERTVYPQSEEKPVKTKIKTKYDTEQGDHYSLFSDTPRSSSSSVDNTVHSVKETEKETSEGKSSGTYHADEKPVGDRKRNKQATGIDKGDEGSSAPSRNISSTDIENGTGSRNQGESKKGDTIPERKDKNIRVRTKGNVKKDVGVESESGRSGKGVVDDQKRIEEFQKAEWEDTGSLISSRTIQFGPIDSSDGFEVCEIVIDDKRYTVSKGSVRDHQYIQGLDSKFLLEHYRPYKIKDK